VSIRILEYQGDAPLDGTMYGMRDGEWERITLMPPVEEYWDITGGLPPTPEEGDRYISDGTDEDLGWYDGYIYEYIDGEWVESIPVEGWMVYLILEMVFWVFFSGGWMDVGEHTYLKLDCSNAPLTGTLSFTDEYAPSPASSANEPAIRANRNIIIKSGHKLIFDGA
jgi:hypothetical protein